MNLFVEVAGLRVESGSNMNILLALHVSAGVLALLSAAVATFLKRGNRFISLRGAHIFGAW